MDKEKVILDLKETNEETERDDLSIGQYKEHGDYNWRWVIKKFGTWLEAKADAGIYSYEGPEYKYKTEELLKDLARVMNEHDGVVSRYVYDEKGMAPQIVIRKRIGNFPEAREKAKKYT
jgi:hypothetical protein